MDTYRGKHRHCKGFRDAPKKLPLNHGHSLQGFQKAGHKVCRKNLRPLPLNGLGSFTPVGAYRFSTDRQNFLLRVAFAYDIRIMV